MESQGSKYECPKCLVSEQKNDQPNATELQHGTQKSPYSDLKKNGNQVTGVFKANIIPNLLSDKFSNYSTRNHLQQFSKQSVFQLLPEIIQLFNQKFSNYSIIFWSSMGLSSSKKSTCPAASNATQAAQHQAGAAAIACPTAARPVLPGPRW